MNSHPLKRADFGTTLEFAAAVRAWHEANPSADEVKRRARRDAAIESRYQAQELARERYAESRTGYGYSDLVQ